MLDLESQQAMVIVAGDLAARASTLSAGVRLARMRKAAADRQRLAAAARLSGTAADDARAATAAQEKDARMATAADLRARCVDVLDKLSTMTVATGLGAVETDEGLQRAKRAALEAELTVLRTKHAEMMAHFQKEPSALSAATVREDVVRRTKEVDEALVYLNRYEEEQSAVLATERSILDEHVLIQEELTSHLRKLKREDGESSGGTRRLRTVLEEQQAKLMALNADLMRAFATFIDEYYPNLDPISRRNKRARVDDESSDESSDEVVPVIQLKMMLSTLMNLNISSEAEPYIRLTDSHHPAYVELLVRAGLAEKHPHDGQMLKLVDFTR